MFISLASYFVINYSVFKKLKTLIKFEEYNASKSSSCNCSQDFFIRINNT